MKTLQWLSTSLNFLVLASHSDLLSDPAFLLSLLTLCHIDQAKQAFLSLLECAKLLAILVLYAYAILPSWNACHFNSVYWNIIHSS